MFKEKTEVEEGKISLGLVLEFHKITWPFCIFIIQLFFMPIHMLALMNGFFGGYGWKIENQIPFMISHFIQVLCIIILMVRLR